MKLSVHIRCRYSDHAKACLKLYYPDRLGYIVAVHPTSVRVIWDGTKTPVPYHRLYIDSVEEVFDTNGITIIKEESVEVSGPYIFYIHPEDKI